MARPGPELPRPTDRDAFLDRLAARLRMPDAEAADVRSELAAHIDDATDDGIARGLSRQEAERAALDRLGSPEAIADEVRRTHQSTRRMFAAVGGGLWQGGRDGVRGYLLGVLLGVGVALGISAIGQLLEAVGHPVHVIADAGVTTVYIAAALWGAAWFGARGIVRGLARGSGRSVGELRLPVAISGMAVLLIPVLSVRASYVWASVLLVLAIPVVFALGALRANHPVVAGVLVRGLTGTGALARRLPTWPTSWPRRSRILAAGFVLMLAALVALALQLYGLVPPPPDVAHAIPAPPLQQRWLASGFDRVTPTVLGRDDAFVNAGFVHEGALNVSLDVAALVGEGWRGFRVEAWRATRTGVNEPFELDPSATGPYAIVEVPDPVDDPSANVDVSRVPGIDRFLLFATGIDPATHRRVAIAWPTEDDTTFYGSVVDWFAALATGGSSLHP